MGKTPVNFIEETDNRYTHLIVLGRAKNSAKGNAQWLCRCDCGNELVVQGISLRSGNTKSCGCLHPSRLIDRVGNRYGRLMVLKRAEAPKGQSQAYWLCQCDCGNTTIVCGSILQNGTTQSCGCLKDDVARERMSLPVGIAAMHRIYSSYERNAKERNLTWALSEEQFLGFTSQPCYYCGAPPGNRYQAEGSNGEFVYNGLDRLDSHKGYSHGNVVPCCTRCNHAKWDLLPLEFLAHVKRIAHHQGWL